MSAAERQRRCRAGGKGRHRGGTISKRTKEQARQHWLELLAAAEAIHAAQQPTGQPDAQLLLWPDARSIAA